MTTTNSHNYRLGYRSDIEGLRAIAILRVVAAPAHVAWLANGFASFDAFFDLTDLTTENATLHVVISGFKHSDTERVCCVAQITKP